MAGKVAAAAGKFLGFGAEAAGAAALAGRAAVAGGAAAAAAGGAAAATGAVAATGAAATVAGGAAAAGAGGAVAAGGAAAAGATAIGLMVKFKRAIIGGGGKHVAKKVGAGLLARYLPYAAGLGTVALGVEATNWGVPALRRFGARHGIKEHSALDNFGTTLGYMGGYAAAGASKFGVAGAIGGAALGLARGVGYTLSGMKPNEHTRNFIRENVERGKATDETNRLYREQQEQHLQDPNTGGDSGLLSTLSSAGFKGKGLDMAYAIAMAESSGHANSHNTNSSTGDNSYGLFQINMIGDMGPARRKQYGLKSNDALFDPLTNAKVAYKMSHGGKNWKPWSTFTSGAYKQYLSKHKDISGRSQDARNKVTAARGGTSGGLNAPADGTITADYGQKPKNNTYWRWKGYHTGRDYGVKSGSTVRAFKEGVVKYSGPGQGLSGAGEPYGNIVVVDHGGYQSMYAHLTRGTVKAGQHVKAGQQIALSGQSGSGAAAGPHLHFEIRNGGFPNSHETDPRPYLGGVKGNGGLRDFGQSLTNSVGNAVKSVWHLAWGALKGNQGPNTMAPGSRAPSTSLWDTITGGITTNVSGDDHSYMGAFGGDKGIPAGISSISSGQGVVINMNVTVNGTSHGDARRFANDVKNILASELRTAKIGSY